MKNQVFYQKLKEKNPHITPEALLDTLIIGKTPVMIREYLHNIVVRGFRKMSGRKVYIVHNPGSIEPHINIVMSYSLTGVTDDRMQFLTEEQEPVNGV